jgi:hypothetical protein
MDRTAQSTISRWSIGAAIFGGVCNLLSWALTNYKDIYLQRVPVVWEPWVIVPETVMLLPLVVLLVLRHLSSVVFIYACVLFLILVWRIQHLVPYKFLWTGAVSYKIDQPGLLLLLLGLVSGVVLLVRAAIWLAGSIRRTQRPGKPAS